MSENNKSTPDQSTLITVVVVCSALVACMLCGVMQSKNDNSKQEEAQRQKEPKRELEAEIYFRDSGVVIKNTSSFEWENCKFELNSQLFESGYSMYTSDLVELFDSDAKQQTVKPGKTYFALYEKFSKPNGEKFNKRTHSPKTLSAVCGKPGNIEIGGWGKR